MTKRYRKIRGTRDILPDEIPRWRFLEETTHRLFGRYGFREIRTPVFESTELFARSVGESSDIVRKEMYTFTRGDESITLRPEATASVVRAAVEHSLYREIGAGYPARFYYMGPMFRHERPQKGRQRQFHQIGVEILGAPGPLADAETLQMIDLYMSELGIEDRELHLGSVGDENCRPAYRERLRTWLEPQLAELCDDCNRRYERNPLRVLDCKVERDQRLLADAPTMMESLCTECSQHFDQVRAALDRYGVEHRTDTRLVRGLDYYRRTVFELRSSSLGAQNAILGGGRYDGLMEELGGPAIPGFGFAMGMERTLLLIPDERVAGQPVDVALIALGPEGFEASILLAQRLRAAGISTLAPLVERPMGTQLKRADKSGARFAAFVGRDELASGRFGLKDLRSGEQTTLDEPGIVKRVREQDDR